MPTSLEVIAHTLDGLVELALDCASFGRQIGRRWFAPLRMFGLRMPHHKPIYPPQESLYAFNPFILPIQITIRRCGEQTIETRGIGAVASHHLVWRDHVSKALGHLGTIFDHHTLGEQAFDRLIVLDKSEIAHTFGPEARIDEVKNGVLYVVNVLVNRKPISNGSSGE